MPDPPTPSPPFAAMTASSSQTSRRRIELVVAPGASTAFLNSSLLTCAWAKLATSQPARAGVRGGNSEPKSQASGSNLLPFVLDLAQEFAEECDKLLVTGRDRRIASDADTQPSTVAAGLASRFTCDDHIVHWAEATCSKRDTGDGLLVAECRYRITK